MNLTFNISQIDSDTAVLISYDGIESEVVIPEIIDRLKIVEIESFCFVGNPFINTVKIPRDVIEINNNAFVDCENLYEIVCENPLKFDLITLNCPNLNYDNNYIYANINNIEIKIISYLDKKIDNLSISNYIHGKKIGKIDSFAFRDLSNLEEANIYTDIDRLNISVFQNCINLSKIILPENLKKIGTSCFENCQSLEKINIPINVKKIEFSTFKNCTNLKEILLPEKLETIGSCSFCNCEKLKNIIIPSKVKTIENFAFVDCLDLESVEFPSSLEEIGKEAFLNCKSLKEIKISKNTKKIYNPTFVNCLELRKAEIPEELKNKGIFYNCPNLKDISYI